LAFAGMIATARAQTPPLSLEDCIKLALEAPSPASVAERETAVAAEQQTIARSALLPRVNVHSGLVYNSPLLANRDQFSFVAANGIREYLSTIDSAWQIDLSGRLRAGLVLARANRDVAGADLRLAQRDLRRAVAVAFYDVVLARRLVELEQAGLDAASDFESLTKERQRQGEASMADVHRAAAQRARFEQRLGQSQLDARLANQVLASFWTAGVDRELNLRDDLAASPPPPAAAMESSPSVDAVVQRRPEFDRLAALQRGFEAERHAARAALLPQTDVVFQYGIDSNHVRVADRGYQAFLSLNIPVFDWFHLRANVRQARYREQQTEQQRATAERMFSREYLAARARVQSWHARVPMALRELTDAKESLRLARLLYENGEGLALDVVAAQTEVTDAGTAYFGALAAYRRSLVDFEVALGQ
jgi:outer membrane protein TolC